MAPTKAKKRPASSSDFRKVKAKVGKRAVKPANVTDTSFKSASVRRASSQTIVDGGDSHQQQLEDEQLLTSRGKTVLDLAGQLRHPAAPARLSAAKGLKDLVLSSTGGGGGAAAATSTTGHIRLIEKHLPVLVPVVAKCCTDEEADVRKIGLDVLDGLLLIILVSQKISSAPGAMMNPHGPLLVSYCNSALNGLDYATRRDGACGIWILSRRIPEVVCGHIPTLLPAFIRLLSERRRRRGGGGGGGGTTSSGGSGNREKNNNRRRGKGKNKKRAGDSNAACAAAAAAAVAGTNTNNDFSILNALLSLLKTAAATLVDDTATITATTTTLKTFSSPDLTIIGNNGPIGSTTRTPSLLLVDTTTSARASAQNTTPTTSSCASDIMMMMINGQHNKNQHQYQRQLFLSQQTCLGLLERIRDILIEANWSGTTTDAADNTTSQQQQQEQGEGDMDSFLTCVKVLRAFYEGFGYDIREGGGGGVVKADPSIMKAHNQILNLILGNFPFRANNDVLNTEICKTVCVMSAVSELASSTTDEYKQKQQQQQKWMKKIASYVMTCMGDVIRRRIAAGKGGDENDNNNNNSYLMISVLEVFRHLVAVRSVYTISSSMRMNLIQKFCQTFFRRDGEKGEGKEESVDGRNADYWIRSPVFRRAVQVGYKIAGLAASHGGCFIKTAANATLQESVVVEEDDDVGRLLVRCLPDFLTVWDCDYVRDSYEAASFLLEFVRRTSNSHYLLDADNINDAGTCMDADEARQQRGALLNRLRTKLTDLVSVSRNKSNGSSKGISNNSNSIFERYNNEKLQRLIISIIVMLDCPTKDTVNALGQICSRSRLRSSSSSSSQPVVTSSVASFIVSSIHSIRKSIPMQTYLQFVLIDSTGIINPSTASSSGGAAGDDKNNHQLQLQSLDIGLEHTCHCLMECNSSKVLSKIQPCLSVCLTVANSNTTTATTTTSDLMIRIRAGIAILAMMSLDIKHNDGGVGSTTFSSVFDYLPGKYASGVVVKACVSFIRQTQQLQKQSDDKHTSLSKSSGEGEDGGGNRGAPSYYHASTSWCRPLIELLSSERHSLLPLVAAAVVVSSSSGAGGNNNQEDEATITAAETTTTINKTATTDDVYDASNDTYINPVDNQGLQILIDVLGAPELLHAMKK